MKNHSPKNTSLGKHFKGVLNRKYMICKFNNFSYRTTIYKDFFTFFKDGGSRHEQTGSITT
jgi:hypothetical protein